MPMGSGFLKQMNDTIKYNRDLLRKRKSVREVYKEEIRKQEIRIEKQALENVRERVTMALRRDRTNELFSKIVAGLLASAILFGLIWFARSYDFHPKKTVRIIDKTQLFKTVLYNQSNGLVLKTDYFIHGPKAAETHLKNGLRHQNTESYYESGEQFRSALYYYDTLINEVYFYKTGDTIANFPKIPHNHIYKLKLPVPSRNLEIEFDVYDGKILQGSYQEHVLLK